MAYSDNPITATRMLSFLMPLVEGKETEWRTGAGEARRVGYKIREALSLIVKYPEEFDRKLVEVADLFRIEIVDGRTVRAIVKKRPTVEVVASSPLRVETAHTHDLESIVVEWDSRRPGEEKLYFPNADLDPAQLEALYDWAQDQGVIFFENSGALTLMPRVGNEDSAPFAWTPDDLEEALDG